MEIILRCLNARALLVAGVAVVLVLIAVRVQRSAHRWRDTFAVPGPAPRDTDIAVDLEARESLRLKTLHRRVSAEISAAKTKGFDSDRLQGIADSALRLDTPAYRSAAIERLNKLRLAVPQASEPLRPAGRDDQ